jgi:lysophospholipase L1-like esterase
MLATGSPPDESLFAKDGLHLSDKGNALWASAIDPVVKEALGE